MNGLYRLEPVAEGAKGQAVVFIHGWGSDNRLWQVLRERIGGQHWGLDLPGFGKSAEVKPIPVHDFIELAARELPESCLLVGWSLGGMIACRLAALRPERVSGLVTLACNPCFVARPDWPWAMPEATYRQFCQDFAAAPHKTWLRFCALQGQGDAQRKSVVLQLKQQPAPEPEQLVNWQNGLHWLQQLDNRSALAELQVPSLHLLGEQDALVPADWADHLDQLWAEAPKKRYTNAQRSGGTLDVSEATENGMSRNPYAPTVQVLAGRGHGLLLDETGAVVTAIQQFVAALPPVIEKTRIARSFAKAADTYDAAAHTQAQAGQRLFELLPHISAENTVLDLGCGTGFLSRHWLAQQKTRPRLIHLDLAEGMVSYARSSLGQRLPDASWVVGDGEALPFADQSLDGIVSNLAIQWCNDLQMLAQEIRRVLKPGGWCLCSTLGSDTLCELKGAWASLDRYVHVNEFLSAERVQGAFTSNGIKVEIFECGALVAQYPSLLSMVKGLKAIGAHNMNQGCKPGLTSLRQWRALEQAYEPYRLSNGLLPATYDVFYFLVRKPHD